MARPQDILLDVETMDLLVVDGDFVIGDSTAQHQKSLLLAAKGDYKWAPTSGVHLFSFINDERPEDMLREVRLQFAKDGMRINRLSQSNYKITIDAEYKS